LLLDAIDGSIAYGKVPSELVSSVRHASPHNIRFHRRALRAAAEPKR